MSKKNHLPGPVPPQNRPAGGKDKNAAEQPVEQAPDQNGTGFQEEDPKRRLGGYTGPGEHSIQQPGGKQGANH